MTVQLLDERVATHAGRVTDRPQLEPNPEVPERARRRTFTAKYKLEVLAGYDAAPTGEKGRCHAGRACTPRTSPSGGGARDLGGGLAALGQLRAPAARTPARGGAGQVASGEGRTGAGAGQGPLRGGCAGKTAGALGDALRERGHRSRVDAVTDEAITTLAPVLGTRAACAAVGRPQASHYRRHPVGPPPARPTRLSDLYAGRTTTSGVRVV